MITPSKRLQRVRRIFDPYRDRNDYVRLDRNEDPVGWDLDMFEALKAALTPHDFAAYADSTNLGNKLARWLGVQPEQLLITAGSDAAIKMVFETYVDPADKVVLQDPSWAMYAVYNDIYMGEALTIPYNAALEFDIARVIEAIGSERIRMVLLANPNQPTGTVMTAAELAAVADAASKRSTLMVVDEAYYMFSPVTALPLIHQYPNVIVTRTFSKAFGLAGLRLGYCVGHQARIQELMLLRPVTDSNSIALKTAEFALEHVDRIERRVADFVAGRSLLIQELAALGVASYESHCNFVLLRCKGPEAAKACVTEVRDRGYLIKGPYGFAPLQNFVRVSVGPLRLMQQFVADCGALLARHAPRRSAAQSQVTTSL